MCLDVWSLMQLDFSVSAKLVVQKQSECSGVLCRFLTILGGCFIQKAVNGFHKDKDLPCNIALYFSVCASWILFFFSCIIQDFFSLITYQASMCFCIKNGKWDWCCPPWTLWNEAGCLLSVQSAGEPNLFSVTSYDPKAAQPLQQATRQKSHWLAMGTLTGLRTVSQTGSKESFSSMPQPKQMLSILLTSMICVSLPMCVLYKHVATASCSNFHSIKSIAVLKTCYFMLW